MNGWYKALENLVWVTQLGFSLLFPLVCILGGCWWLNTQRGVGGWIYLPGLFLGLAVGGSTFWKLAKRWLGQAKKDSRERPAGYNKH